MSVLVTMKVQGDTDQFRRVLADQSDRIVALSAKARDAGCIHHQFGVGDGFVVVVDEWESADQFQSFITSPEIGAVMADMGAQSEPEVEISESIYSPDRF